MVFPGPLKFTAFILRETVISKRPSVIVIWKSGSMEGLFVETVATDGNCQIFSIEFLTGTSVSNK
jgi:hypothetical protein